MKVELKENVCIITREEGDPRFYGRINGAAESRLLYHVKNILNAQGNDLIKKRMWKDGHLVDDLQQYLRTRNPKSPGEHVYILNNSWAVYDAGAALMEDGTVTLMVVRDIWNRA